MNLETLIKPHLWSAISSAYKAKNYSHAILDAMHLLSDLLREKSGLDGDGHRLVGAALGGPSPILRINKFQTETERNAQKGFENTLRGLYQGIRNPRSHAQIEDTQETADAIIYFINYLINILDESKEPFTISSLLFQVFDEHFVESERYAELLVSEIPVGKRLDSLIEIYRQRREGKGENLKFIVNELLKLLEDNQIEQFLLIVSEELRVIQNDIDIRLTLQMLPPNLWSKLTEAARLRTENILLKSISEGQSNSKGTTVRGAGALGTWAQSFLQYFDSKSEAREVIIKKLQQDEASQRYIFNFFLSTLPSLYKSDYKYLCIRAIIQAIKAELDDDLAEQLRASFWSFPDDWRNSLEKALPNIFDEADIPF